MFREAAARDQAGGGEGTAASAAKAFDSVADTERRLAAQGYVADEALATTLFLALRLGRPLFLEGAPGVGKTELAKVVSRSLGAELIRLQCHEGLDLSGAAYEWNYPRQLLEIQARRDTARAVELFSEEYLLRRPLLAAIDPVREAAPVLLIDELDRADDEFESFLLELLSDFQITIPELGTVRARHRPIVFITSNRTREVHDALKRRCLYHWVDYPRPEQEREILRRKVPGLAEQLSEDIVRVAARLRALDLYKAPGVAESIDWARALAVLGTERLSAERLVESAGCLLKHRDDIERLRAGLAGELAGVVNG